MTPEKRDRELKGAFYTPPIWVELSQKYLAEVLGEDWQEEYYIWDCAAGTGNLLAGLTNKYNIWASTLDQQDVDVMQDRIRNGANLREENIFQFDFLNDDFSKLPQDLQDIINNPKERQKLLIYINPPYAEASNKKTLKSRKKGNIGVEQSMVNEKYASFLGQGNAEIFAQFLTRIYFELKGCKLAQFSKLKILSGQHFVDFRKFFLAKLHKIFMVPANTFDNVKGSFPIGFMIWDTHKEDKFKQIKADVYDKTGIFISKKTLLAYDNSQYINDWIKPFRGNKEENHIIGKFPFKGNDFQNQNLIAIVHPNMVYNKEAGQFLINKKNLVVASVYYAVRKVIPATWINDRDQFLYPNKKWQKDIEFQHDCLAYTLFNNTIKSEYGENNWIPFREQDIEACGLFSSRFMADFLAGKAVLEDESLFEKTKKKKAKAIEFSEEAKEVFEAGKSLWTYYHSEVQNNLTWGKTANANASLYDIREYFQGRNPKTKRMNSKSEDETYMKLINDLRDKLKDLAKKIEPKVYAYGFLKE